MFTRMFTIFTEANFIAFCSALNFANGIAINASLAIIKIIQVMNMVLSLYSSNSAIVVLAANASSTNKLVVLSNEISAVLYTFGLSSSLFTKLKNAVSIP